jgi:hypothetical protein
MNAETLRVVARCRHRLPNPEIVGAMTWDILKAKVRRYPHLRPCPRCTGELGTWNWVYVRNCASCPDREGANADA